MSVNHRQNQIHKKLRAEIENIVYMCLGIFHIIVNNTNRCSQVLKQKYLLRRKMTNVDIWGKKSLGLILARALYNYTSTTADRIGQNTTLTTQQSCIFIIPVFGPKFVWISWNTTWLNNVPRDSVYTNIQLFLLRRIEYNTLEGCPEITNHTIPQHEPAPISIKQMIIITEELENIIMWKWHFVSTIRLWACWTRGKLALLCMIEMEICLDWSAQYNYRNG